MGDPGGIGPEVIARTLQDPEKFSPAFLLLIGTASVFEFLEDELHLRLPLNPVPTLDPDFLRDDSVNFLDVTEEAERLLKSRAAGSSDGLFDIGRVSATNAAMALVALKAGAYQGATGLIDALVTGPVSKEAMRLVEPKFVGHTEYLAKVARVREFAMMFLNEDPLLRVTLVTIHVPLKKVSRLITKEAVTEKIRLTHDFLKERLGIAKPRIAVCALNPHGKESGDEEEKMIATAIEDVRKDKISVSGPHSGDSIFYEAYQGRYDAVVAMYHDQGLAPFKLVAFNTGVNLTLGLPYIRTSPDHGTAFDIAYQGRADARSMEAALQCAANLVKNQKSNIKYQNDTAK